MIKTTSKDIMSSPKTYFIRTYGCQMNELDSEVMEGILKKNGYRKTSSEDEANILIFNTCSVRQLAEEKVIGKIGILLRKKKPHRKIGIAGCMAVSQKEQLIKKFPQIDFILGTNNIADLEEVLAKLDDSTSAQIKIDPVCHNEPDYLLAQRKSPIKAYVSITRGCNNYCSYCIVPFTRGKEISRPIKDILTECRQLVDNGYQEIILLGQNVNSYGLDFKENTYLFPDLLKDLDKIPHLKRIRFLTSHPKDISVDLMQAIRDLPSVCESVHFPLQSGSDAILKKMNRRYTYEEYYHKILMLKELIPNIAIGTDIIVGFPTESDEDYQLTVNAFKEIQYHTAFIFAYSPRPNTLALRYNDDVPHLVKQERLQNLLSLHESHVENGNRSLLGQSVEVLIEGKNKDNSMLSGKTRRGDKVIFPGDKKLVGSLVHLSLESFSHQTFIGKLL